MSFLKRLLGDDLLPLLRRSSAAKSPDGDAEPLGIGAKADAAERPGPIGASSPRPTVVILNWKAGENDPFSVVTNTVRQHFRVCGKNVEVLEVTTADWPSRLFALVPAGIEFVLTWQGFCSDLTIGDQGESLWDRLAVPLICIHGDHPSQMPSNHRLDSPYCLHLYTNAEFARYANRHFPRARPASVIDIPQVHLDARLGRRDGDWFVFAKNVNDPLDTERMWQRDLGKEEFDIFMTAAETLKSRITREPYVDMHEVLDEVLADHGPAWLSPASNAAGYHQFHTQLDHYMRSHKSIAVVEALRDFPVRIYGRGWDRIAQSAPASHVFLPGRDMAESQELYYSRFGLVDVSPSRGLHDRTRRAMVNGSGFLSSANLEESFADIARFNSLFYSFRPEELPEKCAAVVRDPDGHHELARQFGDLYHDRYHFRKFVDRIDALAKSAVPR